MRHQNKVAKLGRTHAHRKATLAALSNALIKHKRITTTLAKAKALRTYVEPIINRAKVDSTHNRRQVFRYLQDKHSVTELFGDIAEKLGARPGGYTRVVKLGQRAGDSAEMAVIELVDYNESGSSSASSGRRRRTRRGRSGAGRKAVAAATATETVDEAVAEAEADAVEAADAIEEVAEEAVEDAEEVAKETGDTVEAAATAPPETEASESSDEATEEEGDKDKDA